jgi:transposase, IS30 family
MISLHQRPPEVAGRLVPGHWEGDLIKGKGNKSCVGTLVERTSRLVILARMEDASAGAALTGFSTALERIDANLRKTFSYDRRHQTGEPSVKVGTPDSWQRLSNSSCQFSNHLFRIAWPIVYIETGGAGSN